MKDSKFENEWLRKKAAPLIPKCPLGRGKKGGINDLCKKHGMTGASISYFMSGRNGLSFWTGVRLATYLGIDLRELQDAVIRGEK